ARAVELVGAGLAEAGPPPLRHHRALLPGHRTPARDRPARHRPSHAVGPRGGGLTVARRVTSYAELLELTGGDPYVRWGVPDPLAGEVLAVPGAVAVERRGRRHGLVVVPTPGDHPARGVDRMLAAIAEEGHVERLGLRSLSVPQEHSALLEARFRLDGGGDWDWMWTTTAPGPVPGEERLVELDDTADAAELVELAAHSPRGEGEPGTGVSELWLGIRDDHGRLVAAGAMQR